jgi:hypothetical protein
MTRRFLIEYCVIQQVHFRKLNKIVVLNEQRFHWNMAGVINT